jgi:hypothetical protein
MLWKWAARCCQQVLPSHSLLQLWDSTTSTPLFLGEQGLSADLLQRLTGGVLNATLAGGRLNTSRGSTSPGDGLLQIGIPLSRPIVVSPRLSVLLLSAPLLPSIPGYTWPPPLQQPTPPGPATNLCPTFTYEPEHASNPCQLSQQLIPSTSHTRSQQHQ